MARDLVRTWYDTVCEFDDANPNWKEQWEREKAEAEGAGDNKGPAGVDCDNDGGLEDEDAADNVHVEEGDVPGPLGGDARDGGAPLGFHYGHLGWCTL